ncbi:MAG: glutathione ABC transporter substrate-binding protein [Dehalococcoidia bacterium]|jgi:peptide/nickel transport system substrate-binding protein|nr:MAG: glutathione ABC transporter substrate-binding protein [Dehalococcoidia bacterium]
MGMVRTVALLTALLAVACSPAAPPPAGQTTPQERRAADQKLTIAVKGIFGNPTPQSSATLHFVYYPLYDNLTAIVGNYEVRPWVAERWELRDDKTWRFILRRDLTWPDGSRLTARDVAFTLETVLQQRWPQQPYFTSVSAVTVVDDFTVDLALEQPDMSIPAAGNFLWIIPRDYFLRVGFDGFVANPVGSGPYELVTFRTADRVVYRKRATPHAFRQAVAEQLTYQVIAENAQIINGLRTGAVDLALDVNFTADQAETLKNAGMELHVGLSTLQYMAFPQGVAELRGTPLREKRVRQALWYAVNREALATTLYKGYAKPAISVAVPDTPYHDPTIPVPPYDPARSRQLLAAAGYPNGFRLPAGLGYNTAFTTQDVIVALQADLRAVGVEFDVVANERAVAVDKAYGRNNLQKEDIWVARQGDPLGFGGSRTFIGCGKPVGDPSALYWCSPEWDRLMDAAYAEKDEQRRAELLKRAARLQVEEAVYQALYVEPLFAAARENIRGFRPVHPLYYHLDSAYRIE